MCLYCTCENSFTVEERSRNVQTAGEGGERRRQEKRDGNILVGSNREGRGGEGGEGAERTTVVAVTSRSKRNRKKNHV